MSLHGVWQSPSPGLIWSVADKDTSRLVCGTVRIAQAPVLGADPRAGGWAGDPDAVAVLTGTQRPACPPGTPHPDAWGALPSPGCLLANKLLGRKLGRRAH